MRKGKNLNLNIPEAAEMVNVVFLMASHGSMSSSWEKKNPDSRVIYASGAKVDHPTAQKCLPTLVNRAFDLLPDVLVVFHDVLINSLGLAKHQQRNPAHIRTLKTADDVVKCLMNLKKECLKRNIELIATTGVRMFKFQGDSCENLCQKVLSKQYNSALMSSGIRYFRCDRLTNSSKCFKTDGVHLTEESLDKSLTECLKFALGQNEKPKDRRGKSNKSKNFEKFSIFQ